MAQIRALGLQGLFLKALPAGLELRNGPTVPGKPPPRGLSPFSWSPFAKIGAGRELSKELTGYRSWTEVPGKPLWLWTPRAATVGSMSFTYDALAMSSPLDGCSAQLACFGAPQRAW